MKGVYIGKKSSFFGRKHLQETKEKMSKNREGKNNSFYGKTHTELSKQIMAQKALDRKHSNDTKQKMSEAKGTFVNLYEKVEKDRFKFIDRFSSARKAAKFINISGTTVIKYLKLGEIYKDKYKFTYK